MVLCGLDSQTRSYEILGVFFFFFFWWYRISDKESPSWEGAKKSPSLISYFTHEGAESQSTCQILQKAVPDHFHLPFYYSLLMWSSFLNGCLLCEAVCTSGDKGLSFSAYLPTPPSTLHGCEGKEWAIFPSYPAGVGGEFLNWNAGGFKPYVDLKVKKQQENIYKVIKPSV